MAPRRRVGSCRNRTGLVLGVLIAAVVIVVPTATPAAESGPKAEDLRRQASEHVAQGQFARGIDALESAYKLVEEPKLLFDVAVAYDQWPGHCPQALEAFDRFLEVCDACEAKEAAEKWGVRLRERCEVALTVRTLPSDAEVRLGEEVVGRTPITLSLRPGPHQIRIGKSGYATSSETVQMVLGRDRALEVVLKAEEPEPIPIRELGPAPPSMRPWMWLSVATTGVGVALGTTFTLLANDSADREAALRAQDAPDPQQLRDLSDEADARASVATAAFVGAGIGAVATFVFWWLEPDIPDRGPGALTFTTDGRGVSVSGRF